MSPPFVFCAKPFFCLGPSSYSQDSLQEHECWTRYTLWIAGTTLSQYNWCWTSKCLHRSWHVCDSRKEKGTCVLPSTCIMFDKFLILHALTACNWKGFLGSSKQGCERIPKILQYAKGKNIHNVHLWWYMVLGFDWPVFYYSLFFYSTSFGTKWRRYFGLGWFK